MLNKFSNNIYYTNLKQVFINQTYSQENTLDNTDTTENNSTIEEPNITLSYDVIKKEDTGFPTNVTISYPFCIKNIEILETNTIIDNESKEQEHTTCEFEFPAQADTTYTLNINLASGEQKSTTLSIDEFLQNNQAPSTPTITAWPTDTSIKKGRNVQLTASGSIDPEEHEFTYIWDGRPAELSQYPVGTHTVKVKAVDKYGAESDWASYTFTVTNVEAATVSYSTTGLSTNYNILGNSSQTTFSNAGYSTVLVVDSSSGSVVNGYGKVDGVEVITTITPILDGNYLKITYAATNTNTSSKTVGIATHADIMINSNDSATIINLPNNTGFIMTDNVYNYNVFLKDFQEVTNVDTYWFGNYGDRTNNLWNNSSISRLDNVDSGMAFSWKNRTIAAGETIEYSIVIGLE